MISRKTAFNQIYKNSLLCYDLIKGKIRKTKQLEDILLKKDYESIKTFLYTNTYFDRNKYLKKYPR